MADGHSLQSASMQSVLPAHLSLLILNSRSPPSASTAARASGNLQRFLWLPIALRALKVKGRRRTRNQLGTAG